MHISSTFSSSQIPASTSPHDHQLQQTQLDEGLKANLLLIINVLTQFLAPIILPFFSADSNLEKFQCKVNLDPNFEQALNTLQIALGIIPSEEAGRRLHNKNSTKREDKVNCEKWETFCSIAQGVSWTSVGMFSVQYMWCQFENSHWAHSKVWWKMLKSSRTWPSILTMAVVQLKFDQTGKYSYSSIAPAAENNNNVTDMTTNSNNNGITNDELVESCNPPTPNHHYRTDDSHKSCRKESIMLSNTRTRSLSSNFSSSTSPAHNSNGTEGSTKPKFCLCELEFRENRGKRSHSIKVDNWELIYKENPLNVTLPGSREMNGHGNYSKWVNVWLDCFRFVSFFLSCLKSTVCDALAHPHSFGW